MKPDRNQEQPTLVLDTLRLLDKSLEMYNEDYRLIIKSWGESGGKHVDFLICLSKDGKPVVEKRIDTEIFKNEEIFKGQKVELKGIKYSTVRSNVVFFEVALVHQAKMYNAGIGVFYLNRVGDLYVSYLEEEQVEFEAD